MYRSFLIRMWRQGEEEGHRAGGQTASRWHAEVLQIQSGESWNFSSREALLSFLQRLTGDAESDCQVEE